MKIENNEKQKNYKSRKDRNGKMQIKQQCINEENNYK